MIGALYMPERTKDLQADYDALVRLLKTWHRTANELDAQVHAMRGEVSVWSERARRDAERVRDLQEKLQEMRDKSDDGANPCSS